MRASRAPLRAAALAAALPPAAPLAPALAVHLAAHGLVATHGAAGRGLAARAALPAGALVLTEAEPLAAAGDPAARGAACAACFRALGGAPAARCARCAARYCGAACRDAHAARGGHEVLCGGEEALDAWSAAHGHNFARVAASAVARSLTGGRDFGDYWAAVNALAFATPPPTDALPRAHVAGYAHVKGAFIAAGRVGGNIHGFFDSVFTLRAYARLMGALRLNAFSIPSGGGEGGGVGGGGAAAAALAAAPPAAAATAAAGSAAAAPAADAGCCAPADAAACGDGGDGGGCAETPAALGDAPGGTAVYAAASLANHACEPSCDVIFSAGGALALRARRALAPGDAVTITYLDSALPVALRRRKLLLGYGFDCNCELCAAQLGRA